MTGMPRPVALSAAGDRLAGLVREAALEREPSPFLVVDDALPPDLYAAMLARLPVPQTIAAMPGDTLRVLPLWEDEDGQGNDPSHGPGDGAAGGSTLRELVSGVFDQRLADVVLDRFEPALDEMYGELFGARAEELRARVTADAWSRAGALDIRSVPNRLAPHTDWPNRLVSLVLYLAPRGATWRPRWGTRLYRVRRAGVTDPVALMAKAVAPPPDFLAPEDYRLLAFRPNRLVAFMNTPYSVHGAEIDGECGERRWAIVKGVNMPRATTAGIFGLPPELA